MATFREALEYAKANPESEFAGELRRRIESGQFDDVARQEGVNLSRVRTLPKPLGEESFVGNLAQSLGRFVGSTAEAIVHPIDTAKALGSVALGGVQKFMPGEQEQEASFDAVANFFNERYGISDLAKGDIGAAGKKIVDTMYKDPVGFAADFYSTFGLAKGAMALRGAKATKVASAPTLAPFRAQYDEAAASAAARQGVALPASSLSRAPAVQAMEAISGKGLFGNKLASRVEKVGERLNEVADEAVRISGGQADAARAGEAVVGGFKKYKESFETAKSAIYDEAERIIRETPALYGEGIRSPLALELGETRGAVRAILEEKASIPGGGENVAYYKKLAKGLGQEVSFEGMRRLHTEVGRKLRSFADPIVSVDRANLSRLYGAIARDLDASAAAIHPSLAKTLTRAKDFYREGIQKINSAYGKTIKRLADQGRTDLIVKKLLTPGMSENDVKLIYQIIGEARRDVQATFLDSFFRKARGTGGTFTGQGIAKQMKTFGETKLQAILSPQQYAVLEDLRVLSEAFARGQKVAQGSQTAFIARLITELVGFGINPSAALKAVMGDAAFSRFIASPTGQKFLTEGVPSPMGRIKRAAQAGATMGAAAYQARRVEEITP